MPSDSVAAFLELARELRLLGDADLVSLADTPDDVELHTVCDRLVAADRLTRYQSDRILTGRGYTLTFAGHPILDELDTMTFRAADSRTRAEITLRRFAGEVPTPIIPPNPMLGAPVAVGSVGGEGYSVHRRPDGADLAALVADMGPMPALLAAEYTRQTAVGLNAAHDAGAVHAHLRADRVFVGPLVQASKPKPDGSPRYRPGPTATVTIADFGLPGGGKTADDVFALGGVLFHLLTGRQPGEVPLTTSRPDIPADLVALVKAMLALAPTDRPTMREVVSRLTALVAPNGDSVPLGKASSPGMPPANVVLAEAVQGEATSDPRPPALPDGWAGHPSIASPPAFTPQGWVPPATDEHPSDEEPTTQRRAKMPPANTRRVIWLLAAAFVGINVLAVLVWVLLILNPFAKK